jgi:hypothetical protein
MPTCALRRQRRQNLCRLNLERAAPTNLLGADLPYRASQELLRARLRGIVSKRLERETLYAELSSKLPSGLRMPGVTTPKSPEVVAGLFSAIERMRLTSSDAVIVATERVMHNVLEAYAQPDTRASMICAEVYTANSFPISSETSVRPAKKEHRALTE